MRATAEGAPPAGAAWQSSLRTRLVLWFVAVLTATLLAFALGLFLTVRHGLWREFDLRLQHEVDAARGLLAPYWTIDGISAPDYINPLPENDRRWVEVWDLQGHRLFQSPQAEVQPHALPPPEAPRTWSTMAADGVPIRVTDAFVDIIGLPAAIRVVEPEAALRSELRALAGSIALGFVLCVAVAMWGGHRITRRALRPMEQLVAQTSAISADRLRQGVAVGEAPDEVGKLAAAFNDTMRRLDVSFEQARRFSADASHELRTPLTAIRTVGQVALQEPLDAAGYRDAIASMLEDAERLSGLLDSLLLLSRAEAGQVELARRPTDLGDLVRGVVDECAVLADEKQQTVIVDARALQAHVDPSVLRLALANLLHNAIRYTPSGGRIDVRVSVDDGRAVVSVRDTGPGIAPEHHTRLFDRFYRVDRGRARETGGSGLGLSIAHWAAAAHGGCITVNSAPGRGSTFSLEVPLV